MKGINRSKKVIRLLGVLLSAVLVAGMLVEGADVTSAGEPDTVQSEGTGTSENKETVTTKSVVAATEQDRPISTDKQKETESQESMETPTTGGSTEQTETPIVGESVESAETPTTEGSNESAETPATTETPTPTATPAVTETPSSDSSDTDREQLEKAIAAAEKVTLSGYTSASTAFFTAALNAAKETAEDSTASTAALERAVQLLGSAEEALVKTRTSYSSDLALAKSGQGDGTYEVNGTLWHATISGQKSMGNDALVKPMELIVSNGQPTLRIELEPLTSSFGSSSLTGYLGYLWYFPDYSGTALPSQSLRKETTVESYYSVTDSYNNPSSGSDSNMKGKYYPHYVTMPVKWSQSTYYVQVYVSVMEAISSGSGTQYAKLELNYDTLNQTAGTEKDSTSMLTALAKLNSMSGIYSKSSHYTAARAALLSAAIAAGNALNGEMNATQTEVDALAEALTDTVAFISDGTAEIAVVDRSALKSAISSADAELAKSGTYTAASLEKLRTVRDQGKAVYDDVDSTQSQIDSAAKSLTGAISALVKSSASSGTSDTSGSSGTSGTDSFASTKKSSKSSKNSSQEKLDINTLSDGTYTITGYMIKVDKKTYSMSNDAINHKILLTVKNGSYTLTMTFKGLKINNQTGYLGRLYYFKSGYQTTGTGAPTGSVAQCTVISYQTDSSGKRFSDSFGTNYPKRVSFPMISEAKKDGWVPLQVFVPIMESISAGTGTQPVYLSLDLNSITSGNSTGGSSDSPADGGSAFASDDALAVAGDSAAAGTGSSSLADWTSLSSASSDGLTDDQGNEENLEDAGALSETAVTTSASSTDQDAEAGEYGSGSEEVIREAPLAFMIRPAAFAIYAAIAAAALLYGFRRKLARARRRIRA